MFGLAPGHGALYMIESCGFKCMQCEIAVAGPASEHIGTRAETGLYMRNGHAATKICARPQGRSIK